MSLLAYYRFDDGSGQTATDSSGHGYDAQVGMDNTVGTGGAIDFTFDNVHPSVHFTDTGSFLFGGGNNQAIRVVGSSVTLEPATSLSVCGWFKLDGFPQGGDIGVIAGKFAFGDESFRLHVCGPNEGNLIKFKVMNAANNSLFEISSSIGIPNTGQWYFVAGVYDAIAQTMKIRVDNTVDTAACNQGRRASGADFIMGGDYGDGPHTFIAGHLDDIRLYDSVLTDAQLDRLANGYDTFTSKTTIQLEQQTDIDAVFAAKSTADLADSSDKRYVTDADLVKLGDLSGTNTGDQDLSGLVPKTTQVNGHALSGDVTLDTSDVGDSVDKRYVTDAESAVIAATSGVNTGDQDLSGLQTTAGFADGETPSGAVNGINQDFTLAHNPNPTSSVHLYLAGLRVDPSLYSVSTNTIHFPVAPVSGAMLADYRY